LAKQFGVSDEALAGLNDPERFPFPPEEGVALRFADAMTHDPRGVDDDLFAELRRHWSEPQIVEIACVIGLFNYFNRFNNALHMEITLTDPEVLLHRVRQVAEAQAGVQELCERTVEILAQGRRYVRVGIYQRQGEMMVLRAYRGPLPPPGSFRVGERKVGTAGRTGATPPELAVPVGDRSGVQGVIEVESDRAATFGEEDRALVEAVAAILAPALAGPAA